VRRLGTRAAMVTRNSRPERGSGAERYRRVISPLVDIMSVIGASQIITRELVLTSRIPLVANRMFDSPGLDERDEAALVSSQAMGAIVKDQRGTAMWDTVDDSNGLHLSHDMPCPSCGHAVHTYLACGDNCSCVPAGLPGGDLWHRALVNA